MELLAVFYVTALAKTALMVIVTALSVCNQCGVGEEVFDVWPDSSSV